MKTFVFILLFLFPCFHLFAQWQPTGGPYSGFVREVKFNNQYAFASCRTGLYRTGNGGESWDKLTIGQAEDYDAVHFNLSEGSLLAHIQVNEDALLSGLYRSDDHGNSWARIYSPGLSLSAIRKLMIFEDKLFLQVSSDEAIFSTDNGLNWLPVEIVEPDSQHFYSDFKVFDGNLYIGGQGRINKLPTGNNSWERITMPVAQMPVRGFYIYGDTIMAGNSVITFRSEDGGESWEQTDEHAFGIVLLDGILYREGFPLYKSMDFGKTWEYVPSNYDDSFYGYIGSTGLATNQGNLLVGDYYGGIYASTNLGISWQRSSVGIYNSAVNAMAIAGDALYVANYYGGSIDRYDFNTGNWNKQPLLEWLYPMVTVTEVNETIFALGELSHNIFRSSNGGQNWDTLNFGYDYYNYALSVENSLIAWEEENFRSPHIHTENLGASWQNLAHEISNQVGINVSSFILGDEIIYAYNNYNMVISRDGGYHWEAIERGTQPSYLGYLTAGGNILLKDWPLLPGSPEVSWDRSATFHSTTGLPERFHNTSLNQPKQRLALVEGNYLLATSSGLYVSQNGGRNWAPLPHNIPTNDMRTICYHQDTIYIGTTYYGVWKAPFDSLSLSPVSGVADGLNPDGNTGPFQLIPNPTSGSVTIKLPHVEAFQGQLLIYNGMGQLLLKRPVQFRSQLTLPELSLSPGYYRAILQSKQEAYTSPLVIQR